MVLTAKFGCARLYSRIMCADMDSRRLNLQACYAEYQWIIAYAEKFDVRIFSGGARPVPGNGARARVRRACRCRCRALPAGHPCSHPPTGVARSRANRCSFVPRQRARCLLRLTSRGRRFARAARQAIARSSSLRLPWGSRPPSQQIAMVASDFAPIFQLLMSRGRCVEQPRLPHTRIAERTGRAWCERVLVRRGSARVGRRRRVRARGLHCWSTEAACICNAE